ncbi:MAG: bifunctional nuclease family protein, partial [Verrucomicrobiota bacterium]
GVITPRPMTHDLIVNLVRDLGAQLDEVVVTELQDKTFFAELRLTRNGVITVVSCRPSDAIAVAAEANFQRLEAAWRRAFPRTPLARIGRFVRRSAFPADAVDLATYRGYEHLT